MKTMLKKAALVAGLVALTAAPAAAQVGVYLGPFGAGIGVYHHPHYYGHRVCRMDYYGYEHCWWQRDWDRY
ncbi:MAG TPA: hypothetical protein VN685_11900 [Rhizomicrobium sp.]|nr:hypothetical protein [Rhizomicrobium sp.]